jgi:hypothetical protein
VNRCGSHHVDDQYFALKPTGASEISAEEAMELARVFGAEGDGGSASRLTRT